MITRLLAGCWKLITISAWTAVLLKVSNSYHVQYDSPGIFESLKPRRLLAATIISTGLVLDVGYKHPHTANAATYVKARISTPIMNEKIDLTPTQQSPGWELARQKRTAAMKAMQNKGIIKINTDDSGNQYLKVPWVPDQILPYKSLSITKRLEGEVFAGAVGELSKDVLLHVVDTAKTRKQALKKSGTSPLVPSNDTISIGKILASLKNNYAGFPIVLVSSIPQGGVFFLVKKGTIELLNKFAPSTPSVISAIFPIGLGVMAYWLFRTPAEVIKTQVQTFQSASCKESLQVAQNSQNGLLGLWKYYPVMLSLDIPFQILNFILFGFVSDAVLHAGYETSILTRLFCGVTCGMITGAVTCPIDVCKTRIISRDKAANAAKDLNIVDAEIAIELGKGTKVGHDLEVEAEVEVEVEIYGANQILTSSNRSSATKSESKPKSIFTESDGTNESLSTKDLKRHEINYFSDRRDTDESEDLGSEFQCQDQGSISGTVLLAPIKKERIRNSGDSDINAIQSWENEMKIDVNLNVISTEVTATAGMDPVEKNVLNTIATESSVFKKIKKDSDNNIIDELFKIIEEEGVGTLFLGIKQRLLYVGLANGIRLAAYGTSRMDLMMKNLDDL